MLSLAKHYSPSRPVHVLHVIGLVGVGKTRFLHEYFPTLPVFDIPTAYREFIFSPNDVKCKTMIDRKYETMIRAMWNKFLSDHDPGENLRATFCVGVESSGIDQTLNVILVPFFPIVLLIHGEPPSLLDKEFWSTRPHGPTLNALLHEKLTTKAISYNYLYDAVTATFSSLLPREFCVYSPQLIHLVTKSPILAEILSSPRMRRCPTCGAPFSTQRLYMLHLQRHATLLG